MTAPTAPTAPDASSTSSALTVLHCRAADGITLRDALGNAPLAGAIALLSSPSAFTVATVSDGPNGGLSCRTAGGDGNADGKTTFDLDDVFEARVFTPQVELRWTATGAGRGRAAVLSEDPSAVADDGPFHERVAPLEAVDTLEASYLLWGHPVPDDPAPEGWTTLYTARVGTLCIPTLEAGPSEDERLQLVAREYVCTEPRHGNAFVAEERLLHLRVAQPERRGSTHG